MNEKSKYLEEINKFFGAQFTGSEQDFIQLMLKDKEHYLDRGRYYLDYDDINFLIDNYDFPLSAFKIMCPENILDNLNIYYMRLIEMCCNNKYLNNIEYKSYIIYILLECIKYKNKLKIIINDDEVYSLIANIKNLKTFT